jgi:CRISPR-associated endonuclease Cas1
MKAKEIIRNIQSDKLATVRKTLLSVEGKFTEHYFHQIFHLLPKSVMIEKRRTYKAYDGINNTFNLAYTVLKWKTHRALIRAKLEPFLGFLHSEQFGKPSLVCDLMELYRYLVDDFIIQYTKTLGKRDFELKQEAFSSKRKSSLTDKDNPLTLLLPMFSMVTLKF